MSVSFSSAPGTRNLLEAVLAAIVLVVTGFPVAAQGGIRFLVDYSSNGCADSTAGFDQVILDPFAAAAELGRGAEEQGEERPDYYAYLSLVEIPGSASYEPEARRRGLILGGLKNEVWASHYANLEKPEWIDFVLETLAAPAVEKGFDGFFLDTADSIQRLPGAEEPARRAAYRARLVELIGKLRQTWPDKRIILNRGFELIGELPAGTLSGVLIESVFQTYDHAAKEYKAVPATDTKLLTAKIAELRKRGLAVQVIDYVDPANAKLAASTAERIEKAGASALITTPDLQGLVLAPANPVARKILVLFGFDADLTANVRIWPVDTEAATQLQAALEWMGYELRFHRASEGTLPELDPSEFAGIIVDGGLSLSPALEQRCAGWLLKQKDRGLKILLAGTYPFLSHRARTTLLQGLGIQGAIDTVVGAKDVRITHKDDDLFDFEREVKVFSYEFVETLAPDKAVSHLHLECKDRFGRVRHFDPVFTCEWGGVILHPYWTFQPSVNRSYSYLDPFLFLDRIFPAGRFPAPDATTRNGLRLLWSHVDGDGFVTLSNIQRGTVCAKIIRDRIFKKYTFPTTVSVIEAEIRALQITQNPKSEEAHTALARDIFRMPSIEAASHAYSHPFFWSEEESPPHNIYEFPSLRLRPEHATTTIDPRREVIGSTHYIERELLPPGKKVKLMLWSGNCRPFPEALRCTRELGIENMNGGFTVHSKRYPQVSAIAPRVTWWDDQLQVFAANQNDYVYTNDWSGPTYGGFEQVIDSFERLDVPRRMKPVNIYYHFYSAANEGAMTALERIHEWAVKQPLHAVTASEAAKLTRGAVHAELRRTGPNRWLVTNHGTLTTFRIPQSLGFPDLAVSTNVTGYNDHGSERYIHTNGKPFAEIVLTTEPRPHLYLRSSEAVVKFRSLSPAYCEFTSKAWRAPALVFGGATPGSSWTLTHKSGDGKTVVSTLIADRSGHLSFKLPAETSASLTPASFTSVR